MPGPSEPTPGESKLIIDTDWKAQAQAEKERLAQKAAAQKAAAAPISPSPAAKPAAPAGASSAPAQAAPTSEQGPDAEAPLNPFEELLRMLAMQALSFLGEVPDPKTGQRIFAPEYARLYIDMLTSLEERTKGNLSKLEQDMLTALSADMRMTWVEVTRAVAKAVAEGKIKPTSGAASAAGGIVTPGA